MAYQVNSKDKVKPKGLKGISDAQVEPHFEKHYKGYVKKINEVWTKLDTVDRSQANQNFSDFRALKVEESFNWMGVVLHELYFENLSNKGGKVSGAIKKAIEKNFGSFEKWKEDFIATGLALRGWSVLVLDLSSGRLINNGLDAHNVYGFMNAIPVLVLDVYEHAYFIDYATARKAYIEAFFKNINWQFVDHRISEYSLFFLKK